MRKIFCITIALILVICSALPVYAGGHWETVPEHTEDFFTPLKNLEMGMWHYSGGYWQAGIGSTYNFQISDAQLGMAMGIDDFVSANCMVDMAFTLGNEISDMFSQGYALSSVGVRHDTLHLADLVDESQGYMGYLDGNTFHLYFYPRLCYSSYTFDDFVSGLGVTIPLTSDEYGYNMYSIFSGSTELGQGNGYFLEDNPTSIKNKFIHPKMIKNYTGYFSDGYTINIKGAAYPSNGYRVGYGTFAAGGAVGLYFIYQFYLRFTFTIPQSRQWVETPDVPETPYVPETPGDSGDEKSGSAEEAAEYKIHRLM